MKKSLRHYIFPFLPLNLPNRMGQPSIATFGSDQFDETDPREGRSKISFFSYFYFALNAGSLPEIPIQC